MRGIHWKCWRCLPATSRSRLTPFPGGRKPFCSFVLSSAPGLIKSSMRSGRICTAAVLPWSRSRRRRALTPREPISTVPGSTGRRSRSARRREKRRRCCRISAARCPTMCFPMHLACPRSGCRIPIRAAPSTRPMGTFFSASLKRRLASWRVGSGIWARCRARREPVCTDYNPENLGNIANGVTEWRSRPVPSRNQGCVPCHCRRLGVVWWSTGSFPFRSKLCMHYFACMTETIQTRRGTNETPAYDWPCACRCVLRLPGECRGAHGDVEEHQGNRRDHTWFPRFIDPVFLSGRQPEADRFCDGHLLQNRRRREEGTQARQARGQAQSGDVIDPHSIAGQRHHRPRMRLDHQQRRTSESDGLCQNPLSDRELVCFEEVQQDQLN